MASHCCGELAAARHACTLPQQACAAHRCRCRPPLQVRRSKRQAQVGVDEEIALDEAGAEGERAERGWLAGRLSGWLAGLCMCVRLRVCLQVLQCKAAAE